MGKQGGKSIVILLIMTILIIIAISVGINYANEMMYETKVQDLRTNMLLMQAETKKGLEEVCVQTVNLVETEDEDLQKINESKQSHLYGIILSEAPEEVREAVKNVPNVTFDEHCYYLDEITLNEIGIKNINKEEYGYFIVKYDFETVNVEVINTNGYNGNYTLTQINQEIDGGQS